MTDDTEATEAAGPPWETDREALERDCTLEFLKGSGPGGQHRNKRETGVRLVHGASGTTVMATERRSQTRNRELAYERMAERIEELNHVDKERVPTRVPPAKKRERVAQKRRTSAKKASRRPKISEEGDS
jgi:protein subunit release factor B